MTTFEASRPLRAPAAAPATTAAPGRTLLNYLLVPRPNDLVKAVVVPLTFALGAAANGGVGATRLWQAVLVWLVLELLVYQARYQWNDVRGFAADQAHPERAARGRLPGPIERARPHITASLAVAALRLLLTAAVGLAVPGLRGVLLAMTVGVFGAAFVYERLRSMATGHTTQVPVPLRPSLLALWVAVGAGYAVRGMTGLALAVQLGGRPALVVAGVLAMWGLGLVFVTCRWALEASCFASFRGEHVVWDAQRSKAREHTLGLVRWLPSTLDRHALPIDAGPAHWRALQGRTSLTAPWHLALVVAAAAAAVAGRLLVAGLATGTGAAVAVGSAAVALAITRLRRRRSLAAPVAALAIAGAQWLAGLDRPLVATLPWLVVMVAYACFTHQCASEIARPLRRLEPLLHR
jgi:hypothetical protein